MNSARGETNPRGAQGGREQTRIEAYLKRQREVAFANEGADDYGDEYGDDARGEYRQEQPDQAIEWPAANQRQQQNYDEDAEDIGWPSQQVDQHQRRVVRHQQDSYDDFDEQARVAQLKQRSKSARHFDSQNEDQSNAIMWGS